jgi:hypothetical protein
MLQKELLVAKIGVATAESGARKGLENRTIQKSPIGIHGMS